MFQLSVITIEKFIKTSLKVIKQSVLVTQEEWFSPASEAIFIIASSPFARALFSVSSRKKAFSIYFEEKKWSGARL